MLLSVASLKLQWANVFVFWDLGMHIISMPKSRTGSEMLVTRNAKSSVPQHRRHTDCTIIMFEYRAEQTERATRQEDFR